jgi:hypothetical protein
LEGSSEKADGWWGNQVEHHVEVTNLLLMTRVAKINHAGAISGRRAERRAGGVEAGGGQ